MGEWSPNKSRVRIMSDPSPVVTWCGTYGNQDAAPLFKENNSLTARVTKAITLPLRASVELDGPTLRKYPKAVSGHSCPIPDRRNARLIRIPSDETRLWSLIT